jgi:HK97 family phage major capsid protein
MMTKDKLAELQAAGQKAVDAAAKIADAAADREMTTREQSEYDAEMKTARELLEKIKTGKHDLAVMEEAKSLAEAIGDAVPAGSGGGLGGGAAKTKGQRLHFASMGARAADKIAAAPGGLKALATSGTVVVEQTFVPDPIALGKPATWLLDVLPVQTVGPQFAYLRQSVRTNAAAIVPEGSVKPTSTYTLVRIEDKLDVVAHLSEAIPRFWVADNVALETFMRSELELGLQVAVEGLIIADIAGTSGIQSQAYSTSVLQTVRKSLTKLETQGYTPASIVLNPSDFEGIELALSTVNAVEHMSLPFDTAARRLWGTPLVVTNAVAAGVAYSLASGAVKVMTDSQGVQVTWSEQSNATDWSENKIRARCEGRWATAVLAPLGCVSCDLTP